MRRVTKSKKIVAALLATTAVIAGSSAAYAYWTTTGSGSGAVSAGTVSAISINQTTVVSNLAPGVAAQVLSGKFTNTNASPVFVTNVTASIGTVTKNGSAPAGTCDATDFTLATPVMTVGHEVASGTNVDSWSGATIAFNNKAGANQDACKLATVAINYTLS